MQDAERAELPTITTKNWTGKVETTYTYHYFNGVPFRDSDDALFFDAFTLLLTI